MVRKRPFMALVLGQAGALVAVYLADLAAGMWLGAGIRQVYMVGAQSLLAPALTRALGLGPGWMAVQFVLPWAALGALQSGLPSWIYLAAFILLYAVYSNAGTDRVPLYLSNRTTQKALCSIIRETGRESGNFLDLGSGLGGMVLHLGRENPGWTFEGVEAAPLVYLAAKARATLDPANRGVKLRFGSIWDEDLSRFDVVYAFLSPHPMHRLLQKAEREMRPGTMLISNSFWDDETPFERRVVLDDARSTVLFIKNM